jgi:transcription factor TGA
MGDLRVALQANLSDQHLQILLENFMSHFYKIFQLKSIAVKADVFHLLSGMYKTPAERCFMWIGGFRPSEILKVK